MPKRSNEYVDPFKVFEMEREANRKRMLQDKRLQVIRGARAADSGTTPETSSGEDKLKFKMGRIAPSSQNKAMSHPNKPMVPSSSIRDTIVALHRQSIRETTAKRTAGPAGSGEDGSKRSISILQLGSLVKETKFSKPTTRRGINNRYQHLSEMLLKHFQAHTYSLLLNQVYASNTKIVNWFINHRYDYIIADKEIASLRENIKSELMAPERRPKLDLILENLLDKAQAQSKANLSMVDKLTQQRYLPRSHRRNKTEPPPTHLVKDTKKVGVYMICCNVIELQTKATSDILLVKCDNRVQLQAEDLIVLSSKSKKSHFINGKEVPVYMNFQLYQKRSLDVDFFA